MFCFDENCQRILKSIMRTKTFCLREHVILKHLVEDVERFKDHFKGVYRIGVLLGNYELSFDLEERTIVHVKVS